MARPGLEPAGRRPRSRHGRHPEADGETRTRTGDTTISVARLGIGESGYYQGFTYAWGRSWTLSDCRYLRTVSGRFGRGWGCAAFMFGGGRTVLTIGKLGTARGRLEYYDAQVAAGAEGYYAGRGGATGRWRGAG